MERGLHTSVFLAGISPLQVDTFTRVKVRVSETRGATTPLEPFLFGGSSRACPPQKNTLFDLPGFDLPAPILHYFDQNIVDYSGFDLPSPFCFVRVSKCWWVSFCVVLGCNDPPGVHIRREPLLLRRPP